MEALLIEEWIGDAAGVLVLDEASLTSVRDRVRTVAGEGGVSAEIVDRAVLVATELGRNQLRHALAGRIIVRALARGAHRGLEILAVDRGAGLVDAAAALEATPRTVGTLGVGIGSIRRLSSEVDFDVRVGEGTRVLARLFGPEAPRRREVGIYGRCHPDEKVSGDNATFCRSEDGGTLLLAVCDGLGHGPPARQAAHAAIEAVRAHASDEPADLLVACEPALAGTRGVVMAACRVDETSSTLVTASVGNIELQVCAPRDVHRFGGSSAVLGGRPNARGTKPRSESASLPPGALVVLTSDGISSKLSIENDLALLRDHPVVIAQRIMDRFGRTTDDAIVLVAR